MVVSIENPEIVKIGQKEIEITDNNTYALVLALAELTEELRKTRME